MNDVETATRGSAAVAPVRKEIEVPCRPDQAFRLFTEEIAQWWPLHSHSISGDRARGCAIEPRPGGEFYEIDGDGRRQVWGTVRVWEPPGRLAFTFHPGRDAANAGTVEVRFAPSGNGSRVTLEHHGWELLGEQAIAMRQSYDHGWGVVFGQCYCEHARRGGESV
jgi:hypothetical protein